MMGCRGCLLSLLASVASPLGGPPPTVVVVTCSAHYTDFFENWLAWLERSGVAGAVGLVAIAEDESAAAYLEAWAASPPPGWHAYRRAVAPPAAGAAPLGGALGFETRGFATLMARRAAYLAAELAALAADGAWAKDPASRLVFSDLDVVWLGAGQHKRAKFPTSKAPISAIFHSFRLNFGRAIISRNGLEAWMPFLERARAEHSR